MIHSYKGKSQPPRQRAQQQLQPHHNNQNLDDFHQNSIQIFRDFDSISNKMFQQMDRQFGSMMPRFRGFDDIEDQLIGFSDLHNDIMNQRQIGGANGFQMVSHSYVQQSKIGPDGQIQTQKYFDKNQVGKGGDGKVISERQQGYKNTATGQDKFSHERRLDNEGRKYVKERDRTGQITTTDHYLNIDESQRNHFDQQWSTYAQNTSFGNLQNKNLTFQQQTTQPNRGLTNNDFVNPNDLGYGVRRATDLQPTQPGRSPQLGLPFHQQNSSNNFQVPQQQQYLQQQQQPQQSQANQRPRQQINGRNEHITGIYQNKNIGRGQYPPSG